MKMPATRRVTKVVWLVASTWLGFVAAFAVYSPNVLATGELAGARTVAAGTSHSCAILDSGRMKCWGSGYQNLLGNGELDSFSTAIDTSVIAEPALALTAGKYHSCAIMAANSSVKCWGWNGYGLLGNGTEHFQFTATDVVDLAGGVRSISAGWLHTCAVTANGGAKCWGSNTHGLLGDGTATTRLSPVDVIGLTTGVKLISTGAYHTCALMIAGNVKCWGLNDVGQLGDGNGGGGEFSVAPVDVKGLTEKAIGLAVGYSSTCVLTVSGRVMCWGYSDPGNGPRNGPTPKEVTGLPPDVASIGSGESFTCVRIADGSLWCWGVNNYGQLGNGTINDSLLPVRVNALDSEVAAFSVNIGHGCAALKSGAVKCWGWNAAGQLGDGSTSPNSTPTSVLVAVPDRLFVASVKNSYGGTIFAGSDIATRVEARDGTLSGSVTTDTNVEIALFLGTGPLTGDVSCVIPAGRGYCYVRGSRLSTPQSGAVFTARRTSGDPLAEGRSAPFDVIQPSNNANLAKLSVVGRSLSPPFASGTLSYSIGDTAGATVSVIPTTADSSAYVHVNGVYVQSGAATSPISLMPGSNTVNVVVTAQDNVTTRSYKIAVNYVAPPEIVPVFEFYNANFDHYFLTWVPAEIQNLDSGRTFGWSRTGKSFKAYNGPQAGTTPVCRIYIPPGRGDGHYFGRDATECMKTISANPTFIVESSTFIYLFLPNAGKCATNAVSVYRVFSNRVDVNHRYTTDRAIRDQMVAKGWLAEGDGQQAVTMCAPQ